MRWKIARRSPTSPLNCQARDLFQNAKALAAIGVNSAAGLQVAQQGGLGELGSCRAFAKLNDRS